MRRNLGGDAHTGAPHPSQPKNAYLFNEAPGRKVEAWEPITGIVYWSAFFILITGLWASPETRIKVREALRFPVGSTSADDVAKRALLFLLWSYRARGS